MVGMPVGNHDIIDVNLFRCDAGLRIALEERIDDYPLFAIRGKYTGMTKEGYFQHIILQTRSVDAPTFNKKVL